MLNDRHKIKMTKDQLDIIFKYVGRIAELKHDNMKDKLLVAHMICIHKKLLPKWTYPSEKNNISLTVPEAIAFWLTFHNYKFADPFVFATMNPILISIHKQYV